MKDTKENNKFRKLSRADATELYKDVHKALGDLKSKKAASQTDSLGRPKMQSNQSAANKLEEELLRDQMQLNSMLETYKTKDGQSGKYAAVMFVVLACAVKIALSAFEWSGVLDVEKVEAKQVASAHVVPNAGFSKEQVTILTALDKRRAELEERQARLDSRSSDIDRRERELTLRMSEMRDITEQLKVDRDKSEKKRNVQIEQLANVYGSMDPKEAATLMAQLDETIALDLIRRMPEKRIGQILASMSPDKALVITRLLSGKM